MPRGWNPSAAEDKGIQVVLYNEVWKTTTKVARRGTLFITAIIMLMLNGN
jgi:hypothetical protein